MEKALKLLGEVKLSETEHLHDDWELVEEYSLSKELLAMSNVWKSRNREQFTISSKGAPEAIFNLCHLPEEKFKELSKVVDIMSGKGLRVLGVAGALINTENLPDNQHDFDFSFMGLIGFADPVRPMVPEAIKECYGAGIRVIMITGDHPGTAMSIGKQVGLKNNDKFITGPELSLFSQEELIERIKDTNIFCRVVPEQKLKIVNALKAIGEIVAMTGDGVNDAPALKSSNIGIAMGGRGTDVAREASALVLLDDDFPSIVGAVRMGRRIFDNLKKAMSYIFSIHVPIAGLSLLPLLINKELILFPIHIVFLELIIDPACSVVFEAEREEADLLSRKPRDVKDPLFGRRNVIMSLLQGVGVLIVCTIMYFVGLYLGKDQFESRTLAFTTLIVANIALILTNRSWSGSFIKSLREKNNAFFGLLAGAVIFMILALYLPAGRELFKFSYIHIGDVFLCVGAGLLSISWFEIYKFMGRR
jgi:Ca2+-transporting ATPase